MKITARLALVMLAVQLAACGQATLSSTFNARARILTLPTDISPMLVLAVDYETFSGNARPGPLPGQSVTVRSIAGATLVCTFSTGSWTLGGPGPCRDAAGRQYDMIINDRPPGLG
jgi:hypothetical protein